MYVVFLDIHAGGIDSNELSSRLAPLASSSPDHSHGRRRSSPSSVARTSSSDVPSRRKRDSGGEYIADDVFKRQCNLIWSLSTIIRFYMVK